MTFDRFTWLLWDMDVMECMEFGQKPLPFEMYKEQYWEWLTLRYAAHVTNAEEELPSP